MVADICTYAVFVQELALYKDMTMAETFNFYGRIFGMNWIEIDNRSLDLLKFLDLPDSTKLIGNLRYNLLQILIILQI